MKSNEKVIDALNKLLREELTAINQYMVHAEMAEDWGYAVFSKREKQTAIDEMKHAEALIERILFLEGEPCVSQLDKIMIGKDMASILENDNILETGAVASYNQAVQVMIAEKDSGTKQVLEEILAQEEGHLDWFEEQQDQLDQMGLPYYLTTIK